MKVIPTDVQRAQAIIDSFKGCPGEFDMLKGILVMDGAIRKAYMDAGASKPEAFSQQRLEFLNAPINLMMIATRMDEIRTARNPGIIFGESNV